MTSVTAFIGGMFDASGGTMFLVTVICGSAIWLMRNQVSSIFILLAVFPLAMIISLAAYHGLELLGAFNPKKMAEWLVWTIMASTFGNLMVVGTAAMITTMLDRGESHQTAAAR